MLDFQRDLKPSVFGPPEINLMRQALNLARRSVCSGSPLSNPDRRPIQEALAALILDHASRGELDPLILAATAVEKFGRPLSCSGGGRSARNAWPPTVPAFLSPHCLFALASRIKDFKMQNDDSIQHEWPIFDWLQPNTNGQSIAQAITSRWWDFQLNALGHSESLIQERWERHKAGTAAAITSTRKMCAAGSPAEMVPGFQALLAGTFARTTGEILAANEHFRAAIAAMGSADLQPKPPAPTSPS